MTYDFRSIRYIPGLNGVRFFAVSIVLLAHYGFGAVIPGGFGVTIFFFLSGFLITTLLCQEYARSNTISIKNFYIRRFLRLGPELLALVIVSGLFWAFLRESPTLGDIVSSLTYTTNYYIIYLQSVSADGQSHVLWPQLWSLAVEEHYYITFPLLFLLIAAGGRRMLLFFATVFVGCLVWRLIVTHTGLSPERWEHAYGYLASETRYDSIAYGAFLAFVAQARLRLTIVQGWAAFLVGLALLLFAFLYRDPDFRETFRYTVQGIGILGIFAAVYLSEACGALARIGDWKPLRIGGDLSYGAYLWHIEYIRLAEHFLPEPVRHLGFMAKLAFVALGFLFSFAAAWVSYSFVAKPMMALRHRFGSRAEE